MNDQNMPVTDLVTKMEEIKKLPTKEAQAAAFQEMREKGQLMTNRLRIGRDYDKSAFIELNDSKGKTRLEITVESNGNPKLNFLDENGKVIYSLPEDAKAKK